MATPISSLYLFGMSVSPSSRSRNRLHSESRKRSGILVKNDGTSPSVWVISLSISSRLRPVMVSSLEHSQMGAQVPTDGCAHGLTKYEFAMDAATSDLVPARKGSSLDHTATWMLPEPGNQSDRVPILFRWSDAKVTSE